MDFERSIIIGTNRFNPPRSAADESLKDICSSPDGLNYTNLAYQMVYKSLGQSGVYNKISHNFFPVLDNQLVNIDPETVAQQRRGLLKNGIGSPWGHWLTPDAPTEHAEIGIVAGIYEYRKLTGKTPRAFWLPEAAIDDQTLRILAIRGVEIVIVAPHQTQLDSGQEAHNTPVLIELGDNLQIVAYPFNRPLSLALSRDSKRNAEVFTGDHISPNLTDRTILGWVDEETFGDHLRGGEKFLIRLINVSLPKSGIKLKSINDLDLSNPQKGKVHERSAWSDPCPDLAKWHGSCACHPGENLSWKQHYYKANQILREMVTDIVRKKTGEGYKRLVIENFREAVNYPGIPGPDFNPALSTLGAITSAELANNSCATFFPNPFTSGNINLLFGQESLVRLRKVSMISEAEEIESEWRSQLRKSVIFIFERGIYVTAEDMLDHMLKHRRPIPQTKQQALSIAA